MTAGQNNVEVHVHTRRLCFFSTSTFGMLLYRHFNVWFERLILFARKNNVERLFSSISEMTLFPSLEGCFPTAVRKICSETRGCLWNIFCCLIFGVTRISTLNWIVHFLLVFILTLTLSITCNLIRQSWFHVGLLLTLILLYYSPSYQVKNKR